MPIQLNGFDPQALASFAGNRVGSLNLPLHSVDTSAYGKALFDVRKARFDADQAMSLELLKQQSEMQRQQMANQGSLAVAQQYGQNQSNNNQQQNLFQGSQNDLDRAQKQKELEMQNQYRMGDLHLKDKEITANVQHNQDQLGMEQDKLQEMSNYHQGSLQNEQDKIHSDKMVEMYKLRKAMTDDQKNIRGGYAGSALFAAQNAKTPEEAQAAVNHLIDKAHEEGAMSDSEYNKIRTEPYNQQLLDLHADLTVTALSNKTNSGAGQSLTTNLSAGMTSPQQATQTKEQEHIINTQDVSSQAQNVSNFAADNPHVFTGQGNVQAWLGTLYERYPAVQKVLTTAANYVPSAVGGDTIRDTVSPEKAKQVAKDKAAFDVLGSNLVSEYAANLSPFLLRNKAFIHTLKPSSSDSQAEAITKSQTLANIGDTTAQLHTSALSQGIPTTSENFKTGVTDAVNQHLDNYNHVITRAKPRTFHGHSIDPIEFMKANPEMSEDEVFKYLEENE